MPMAHRIEVLIISLIEPRIFLVKFTHVQIYEIHEKKATTYTTLKCYSTVLLTTTVIHETADM